MHHASLHRSDRVCSKERRTMARELTRRRLLALGAGMVLAGPGWVHDEKFTNEFMQANPNIEVKIEEIVYGEMYKKSLALGATGTLGDVFAGHNRWTPYQAFKGLCLELDAFMKS